MKALRIQAPGEVELAEIPVPQPGPREVLVKVLAVTTSPHWDMRVLAGEPMFPGVSLAYPHEAGQPGHEACGEIAAIGEGVAGLQEGQRVVIWRNPGHHVAGCYAQYVVKSAEDVIPVSPALTPEACAPLELGMCVAAHVLLGEALGVLENQRTAVFGLGPAGLAALQLLRAAGASEVVGVEPRAERRELALTLGAARCLAPDELEAAGLPLRGQAGAISCAFDCVGVPEAVHQAMDHTYGLVVLFAVQRERYGLEPRHWPGLIVAGAQPHTRAAAEYAVGRLISGQLNLAPLVTETRPMTPEAYVDAVDMLRERKALKVAFLPHAG